MLQQLGTLRVLLLALVALCLPMAPFANAEPVGWGVMTAYIAPSLAVLLFFVLLLDALMSKVFAIDLSGTERRPHQLRMRADLLGVAAILLSWGPFFYGLLQV